jgi:hypothetical protein
MTDEMKEPGKRGRPRKLDPETKIEWRLRAPDNLLMELRICARIANRSLNEEINSRLSVSLGYQTGAKIIKTTEAEKLVSLTAYFSNWLSEFVQMPNHNTSPAKPEAENEIVWFWRNGEKTPLEGKASGYSIRMPADLSEELKIMARIHKRGLNEEVITRLMVSLNYFTECVLDHNEDTQALKLLCLKFKEFIAEEILKAETEESPKDKPT